MGGGKKCVLGRGVILIQLGLDHVKNYEVR